VERVTMTRDDRGKLEESAADRVMLWERALDMFHQSPLIGKGFNTFAYAGFIDTHNYFLKMLAEQGLMGLSAFLFLLISAMRLAWKLYREAEDEFFKGIGFGFALSVMSLMITNFFGDRRSYLCMGSYFFAFMGIMTRSYMINRSQIGEGETEPAAQVPSGARPAYVTIDDRANDRRQIRGVP
jgi:putative inorganic carbon (HCO3(-)) transporter